jgi:hypothetical protein
MTRFTEFPAMKRKILCVIALAGCAIAVPQSALAVVPVVKTVPWDAGNFALPHTTYSGKTVTLKGTSDQQAANFVFDWDPGDGGAHCTGTVTNQYVVQCTHTYAGAVATTWTAVLKITDTNTGDNASANYPLIMEANNLDSNVNVAIDEGLWYLHSQMRRYVQGGMDFGDWFSGCVSGIVCQNTWGTTATNLQAFEVNTHLESASPLDPYSDDVARGLKALFANLTGGFNPGGVFTVPGGCAVPPCSINPDLNGNHLALRIASGSQNYEDGMVMDAIIASQTPAAVTTTGPVGVVGRAYSDVIQDMVDAYTYCVVRAGTGGGWRYGCPDSVGDGSVSQWAAIGIIAAVRAFGATVDSNLIGWNNVWLGAGNSENPATGEFGYTSPAPVWGPYATTPSGLVQLSMDGIGRGDPRWDKAETFLRNNFGNPTTNSNVSIKAYFYGLFSFTKAMLLHNPGGVLTPIKFLHSSTLPPGSDLDWYAAEVSKGDPTDGVARWLVSQQNPAGYWYDTLEINTGSQWPFSTGFAIIMLKRSVFVSCVSDLTGKGTPAGRAPARVDLTWSPIAGADHYDVLGGTTSGGPYDLEGTSSITAFMDNVALVSGGTYYYVVQPKTLSDVAICQSNEAKVVIPAAR